MTRIGLITGSGSYEWEGLADPCSHHVRTEYGEADVTEGRLAGVEMVHLSRHGSAHARLSNHVDHRANLAALQACGVDAVLSLTVCGAVDSSVPLGGLIVFDDLYFPSNRLPDGSLCTWHTEPAAAGRGHWIFDRPFSSPLRKALIAAARDTDAQLVDSGCYGHVDGPRFNSRAEIAALAAAGVTAISQTAGPEVVLAGESELPLALLGYVTDYANGVADTSEPVEALLSRIADSQRVFATVLDSALPRIADPTVPGIVHRFTP